MRSSGGGMNGTGGTAGPFGRPLRRRPAAVRWLLRHRRLIAVLLFCAAAGTAVDALVPSPPALERVVVAARDLAPGTVLDPSALMLGQMAPASLPASHFSAPSALTGKQLAGPLRRGQILSDTALVGPGLLTGSPPGTVAVPLRLADPASVPLVRPGQRVNVILSSADGTGGPARSEVLASSVAVLWTSPPGQQKSAWPNSGDADGLVVVAASEGQSVRLAGAQSRGKVALVLVGVPESGNDR